VFFFLPNCFLEASKHSESPAISHIDSGILSFLIEARNPANTHYFITKLGEPHTVCYLRVLQGSAVMVLKYQLATACFSLGPPHLNSSKYKSFSEDNKIIFPNYAVHRKPKTEIPHPLSEGATSYHHNISSIQPLPE
jgi:hypothetical protein